MAFMFWFWRSITSLLHILKNRRERGTSMLFCNRNFHVLLTPAVKLLRRLKMEVPVFKTSHTKTPIANASFRLMANTSALSSFLRIFSTARRICVITYDNWNASFQFCDGFCARLNCSTVKWRSLTNEFLLFNSDLRRRSSFKCCVLITGQGSM